MINVTHLHPMLVHFPISLFFTAAFFDIAHRLTQNKDFKKMGYYLLILAVLSGVFATASGMYIEGKIEASGIREQYIDDHKGFALVTMAFFVSLLAFRFFKKNNFSGKQFNFYLVFFLIGIILLSLAAFRGGKLVYEYGAAVQQLPIVEQKR